MTNRTLTAVRGLAVGHAHDRDARTGCTAVLGPFRAAVEVRGLATGTREMDALSPLHLVPWCDALLLTGGSAFGLGAADGVTRWLEERGRGFPTAAARVPIVPAAVIYDLAVGDPSVRPDAGMGYAAAQAAGAGPVPEGRVGAGCGATVGKLGGGGTGEPGGVGSWADTRGDHTVAALAVVNAFGDVVDGEGAVLAGARGADGRHLDTDRAIRAGELPPGFRPPDGGDTGGAPGRDADGAGAATGGGDATGGPVAENTTLAVVATDAPLGKRELEMVARQAMNGLIRRVRPACTPFDGDVAFALSTGGLEEGAGPGITRPDRVLALGLRARAALEHAVQRAVTAGDRDGGDRDGGGAT